MSHQFLDKHTAACIRYNRRGGFYGTDRTAHGRCQLVGGSLDLHPVPEGSVTTGAARGGAGPGEETRDQT